MIPNRKSIPAIRRQLVEWAVANGVCTCCFGRWAEAGYKQCIRCRVYKYHHNRKDLEERRKKNRDYYQRNREEILRKKAIRDKEKKLKRSR